MIKIQEPIDGRGNYHWIPWQKQMNYVVIGSPAVYQIVHHPVAF